MTNTIVISLINIIALVILSRMINGNNVLVDQRKKPFAFGIALTIVVLLAEIGTIVASDGGSSWRSLNIFSNVLGFMLTPFIPVVFLAIFDIKMIQTRLFLLLPAFFNGIAAILSPIFGLLFSIDANNQYTRGDLFFLFVTVYMMHLLYLVVITLRHVRRHLYSIQWNLFGLIVFVVSGTFIQLVFPSIHTSWHIVTLSLFIYYILLLEYDGRFDSLTGLYNRSAFEKDIRFMKKRMQYTVIVMDLNDFKSINDTYGHDHGDTVLKKIATIIKESFDTECNSYRIGGDEFTVLCKCSDSEKIEHRLKDMTSRLAEESKNDISLPTISYGSSMSKTDIPDIQIMLKEADLEMYIYKEKQKEKM
jgi:diguanylate cyclase (GGDEF)-like protein